MFGVRQTEHPKMYLLEKFHGPRIPPAWPCLLYAGSGKVDQIIFQLSYHLMTLKIDVSTLLITFPFNKMDLQMFSDLLEKFFVFSGF